jgi:predicted ester cyclase
LLAFLAYLAYLALPYRSQKEVVVSIEQHKATIQRFVEPWNTGEVAILDEVCAADYVLHGLGGLQELKQAITDYRKDIPDLQCTIEEMIAEGDKVAYRWIMRGTQAGKPIVSTGITILRFADGKIVEDRFEGNTADQGETT